MGAFLDITQDFLSLFFPELCAACGTPLYKNESAICTSCIYHLPVTNFHGDPTNKFCKQLWGRFNFKHASSFVFFRKGDRVQNIIHQLKYNKRPEVGFRMGQLYGTVLKDCKIWDNPDLIVPVPLHPTRLKQRGYNQSESFADGIASVLSVPVINDILIRREYTKTQTQKSRFGRYENLRSAFLCRQPEAFANKHILIVDDVMTTGATIEACCLTLSEIENLEISISTIAFTE
jgi:ComF family protein